MLRVPSAAGVVWFKACPLPAFEPRLTASLYERWPDRVVQVLASDEARGWLLLADAGTPCGAFGNSVDALAAALPLYAELQLGEVLHAEEQLAAGVPDLRTAALPAQFDALLESDAPFTAEERERARRFAPRFAELCAATSTPSTVGS